MWLSGFRMTQHMLHAWYLKVAYGLKTHILNPF